MSLRIPQVLSFCMMLCKIGLFVSRVFRSIRSASQQRSEFRTAMPSNSPSTGCSYKYIGCCKTFDTGGS